MSEIVEGRCTKEQCENKEERTGSCGCVFQCQNWGKGLGCFWIRIEDCSKHKEMVRKAVEESV